MSSAEAQPAAAAAPASQDQQPAAQAAPAAADPNAEAAAQQRIDDLKRKISELEASNDEKKKRLETLTNEAAEANKDAESVKQSVQQASEKQSSLTSERDGLRKQHTDILPAYERCVQNKEVKERAQASKNTIDKLEKQIADDHAELQRLAQELERVGHRYEESISRKNRLFEQLRSQVSGLLTAVTQKIDQTVTNPSIMKTDDLAHIADVCSDLVEQREREFRAARQHQRELDAGMQLKDDMLQTMQSGTDNQLAEKRKQRDEFIKEQVFRMQEERNTLQADIDEVRRVNDDQATNLVKGHIQKSLDPVSFKRQDSGAVAKRSASSAATTHGRLTRFAEPAKPSAEEAMIVAQNDAIARDILASQQKIALETRNKTELAKTHKAMADKVKRDAEKFASALQELEAKVVAQVAATRLLEKDNNRVVDQVDHLTTTLKGTKNHLERIRGRAEPLPIEE